METTIITDIPMEKNKEVIGRINAAFREIIKKKKIIKSDFKKDLKTIKQKKVQKYRYKGKLFLTITENQKGNIFYISVKKEK